MSTALVYVQSVDSVTHTSSAERPTLMLLLLLLRPLDGAKHVLRPVNSIVSMFAKGPAAASWRLKPPDLSSSTRRMVCRSSSAPAVLRASSILPMASIPKVVLRFLQQLYGEAYGETNKHCSGCGCSVASVYQGNVHSGTDKTATRFASLHTLLCTLWPRSAHYVAMEHAAAGVQVNVLAD